MIFIYTYVCLIGLFVCLFVCTLLASVVLIPPVCTILQYKNISCFV